jgi:hypothetical protein
MTSYVFEKRKSDFMALRQEGLIYADKTDLVYRLAKGGSSYFFSRPRRFGKTLLLSTLQSLFECRKGLFEGKKELVDGKEVFVDPLWIVKSEDAKWDWTTSRPVIRLDFSGIAKDDPEKMGKSVLNTLLEISDEKKVEPRGDNYVDVFNSLVRRLCSKDAE